MGRNLVLSQVDVMHCVSPLKAYPILNENGGGVDGEGVDEKS